MLPYAALHQLLEPPDRGGVRARVVQHDDGAVLDVVQPPLGRDVTAKEGGTVDPSPGLVVVSAKLQNVPPATLSHKK